MNIISFLNRINATGRYLLMIVLVLNLFSVVIADESTTDGATNLCEGLKTMCQISQTFLAAAIMIMIVLAGATYAIGQILGAETRARASVWATAMLTGAIIGALIYVIAPMVIKGILGNQIGTQQLGDDPCAFTCTGTTTGP